MKFSHFFINRPIFASVLSIVIVLVGALAMLKLPVAQFPDIVPPTVVVAARYPGANPQVVADTVASLIEQEVNGVENMLYMSAQCAGDGGMTLTITFKLGTDIDKAQVQVQNRVAVALPKLPEEVRRMGVTTDKRSPDITMVVNLISPDGRYDKLYIDNYAYLQVKDVLARLPGVGNVTVFGARDYAMRVWLDPEKVAARGLTANDVVNAIREQNVQVAAGVIGQPPMAQGVPFQLTVNAQGRLMDEQQFGDIVIKSGADGQITRVRDVARVELAARDYSMDSKLNGEPNATLGIFQLPGSNSIKTSDAVRDAMEQLKGRFPPGLDYRIVFDTTGFTRESIRAVVHTLIEAMLLVVLVVVIFLQTWRASIIPLLAVPVSLIGTFAAMSAMGFSLNNLSLFGLVLAIGIVVDDAIVVVENVSRHIEEGMSPRDATHKAMDEVSSAVVAVGLVLSAVFIPTAFISGITGQFYRQFALTIAVSTLISAFNSLTLSPALCAILLQPHGARHDRFTRLLDGAFGWFFNGFNRIFKKSTAAYSRTVGRLIRFSAAALAVYLALLGLTYFGFKKVPAGFIPQQDKGYLAMMAQLPDASSLERTGEVIDRISKIARETPGVKATIDLAGLSPVSLTASPSAGTIFVILDDFRERTKRGLSSDVIVADLRRRCAGIQEAFVGVFPPPAVNGLGIVGGFKMQLQDRGGAGLGALQAATFDLMATANKQPGLHDVFSTFRAATPQLYVDVDRIKAKSMRVPLSEIFDTLQIYLGSLYVNDFNLFGRTYQVTAQADAPFRREPKDILQLKTRNAAGEIVPLGTLVKVREITGPDKIVRYNMYPSAELTGTAAPGISSGQAIAMMEQLAKEKLPSSMGFEWTELTLQEILAGNTAVFIFPLCVLFVFLTLAAQYESWSLPLAIILIVPMCLLSAIAGVWLRGMDNNIFTQIGFVVLVGLACKNAILIVQFAKQRQEAGLSRADAAVEASRLRLRPILMTSFAFIFGVIPLVLARGAGAEMRRALGTAVFSGMLGVTLFGIFLTPVFYFVLMKFARQKKPAPAPETKDPAPGPAGAAAGVVAIALLLNVTSAKAGSLAVGPDYKRPTNSVPANYKSEELGSWKEGKPLDNLPKGNWWEIFGDTNLNQLESQALKTNQNLKAAVARVDQARAIARVVRSDLLPSLSLDPSANRQRFSPNQTPSFGSPTVNTFRAPLDLSYEIDLWGRVRRGFESARADAQASLAAFYNVLLTLEGDVAQNYFALRSLDAEIATVAGTVDLRKEQVRLVRSRFEGGIGNELDVARAETELATTEAEAASLARRRAELENALAILTGANPAGFRLAALGGTNTSWNPQPPAIPAGLPSGLLERRPDVAEAERQLASANAKIGVAKASFFPVLSLTGSGGYVSGDVDTLFKWDSRTWSIGPSLSLPIFAGSRNRANYKRSQAAFEEAVARYRQQVLVAFGEVENSLSGIRYLAEQSAAQQRAVASARHATDLATNRFRSGIVGYIEVVDASRDALSAERANAQLAGQRLIAAVQLIKALGGGWTDQQIFTGASSSNSFASGHGATAPERGEGGQPSNRNRK